MGLAVRSKGYIVRVGVNVIKYKMKDQVIETKYSSVLGIYR